MIPASRYFRRNRVHLAAIALLAGPVVQASAQVPVRDIDLAEEGPGDLGTEAVSPASGYVLRINHLVPRRVAAGAYTITMVVRTDTLEPFRIADIQPPSDSNVSAFEGVDRGRPNSCATIARAIGAVEASDTEPDTRTTVAALKAVYRSAPLDCQKWVDEHLIGAAQKIVNLPALRRGQSLTLTISTQVPGATSRQWRRVYSTGPRGRWGPVYSFAFIGRAINEPRYFAKQSGAKYILTKQNNRDWVDFVPSVFFTWTPADADLGTAIWSWTGGLGFDMTAPVVMVGGSARYHENIMLSFGLALHQQQVLLGKYEEGDTLSENLTETQLHSLSFRPNPYLSIGFRFGANPFSAP